MKQYIDNFRKYKGLLKELVVRDVKLKYRRSYLGVLWTLLNPLLMMMVLTIVFSTLFEKRIENFPVYLLTGRLLFDFYSQGTKDSMNSIIGSSSLIKKVYIPKYVFPISKVLSAFVNLGFSLSALVIVMVVTGVDFNPTLILFPLPLIFLLIFTMGISLIISSYTVFFRDIKHLYGVFLTALSYLTPLFYPAESIENSIYHIILRCNPLYYFINMFRKIVLYNTVPTLHNIVVCAIISITALVIGLIVFYKKQDKFILYI